MKQSIVFLCCVANFECSTKEEKKSIYILFKSIIAMLFALNVFMMYKTQDVKNDCQVLLSSSAGAVVEHGALYISLQNTFVSLMMRKL